MIGTMRWLFAMGCMALAGSTFGAAGCGGDDSAPQAQFAEQCDSSCEEGLECLNRLCTARCGDVSVCRAFSDTAICHAGYCYEPCQSTFNCPNGLTCTMVGSTQGTCRVQ